MDDLGSKPTLTLQVYIDNGVVYEYDVATPRQAREHADAIIKGGYRHNDGKGEVIAYPPHRVVSVALLVGTLPTMYPDRESGT